jgi:ubiquinone/menaquinone biosynthesis C-methylase UbiE
MLHVAPEPALEKLFSKQIGSGYLTADLYNSNVMVKMDITDIQYPDESFDAIFCSHVLEHVDDDRKAMSELSRVLKKNGWAIFMVPVNSEVTIEDPDITDPVERFRLFGQQDHVRSYGHDFTQRLEQTGFEVKVISPSDFLSNEEMIKMGVIECTGDIFFCTKT